MEGTNANPPEHPPVRAIELHRFVAGPASAPVVLALHGITESRRYWLPRLLPLAQRYRLIIPDLPGFGMSPKPFTDYTPAFFVESVRALLAQEGAVEPVRIVGHSLGALLALEYAARYPAGVERIALLNVPRFDDPEEAHKVWFAGSYSYRNLLSSNSMAANIAQMRRSGVRLATRYMRRLPWHVVADSRRFTFRSLTSTLENCLLHYAIDRVLPSVPAIPVLLIHGDEDQVAPLSHVLKLPTRHPYPWLYVIRRAGHHPLHTHGDLCVRLIEAHLNGAEASVAAANGSFVVAPPRHEDRRREWDP